MYAGHFENIDSKDVNGLSRTVRFATIYRLRIGSFAAEFSCGWSAPRRLLKAAACQDVWAHAAQSGCQLRHPLMHE
jgi:hypothetical protein